MLKPFMVAFVVLVESLFVVDHAHAYVDPGSGSMLLQLLLGGVAGAAVLVKYYWQRIRALFGFPERE